MAKKLPYCVCPSNRVTINGKRLLLEQAVRNLLAMNNIAQRCMAISLADARRLQQFNPGLVVTDGHGGYRPMFVGTMEEMRNRISALASYDPSDGSDFPVHREQEV